jgi:hypothetical protein
VRIFKNKWFVRFAEDEGIDDETLCEAVQMAEQGKIDANLGGGVIKQRLARRGAGKSAGYRSIILYRKGDKAFFVYGFAKNSRDNITRNDEKNFKESAKFVLNLSDDDIKKLIKEHNWQEVRCNGKKI